MITTLIEFYQIGLLCALVLNAIVYCLFIVKWLSEWFDAYTDDKVYEGPSNAAIKIGMWPFAKDEQIERWYDAEGDIIVLGLGARVIGSLLWPVFTVGILAISIARGTRSIRRTQKALAAYKTTLDEHISNPDAHKQST